MLKPHADGSIEMLLFVVYTLKSSPRVPPARHAGDFRPLLLFQSPNYANRKGAATSQVS
jgi:hypothetical protein